MNNAKTVRDVVFTEFGTDNYKIHSKKLSTTDFERFNQALVDEYNNTYSAEHQMLNAGDVNRVFDSLKIE